MMRVEIELAESNGRSKLVFVDEKGLSVRSIAGYETDGA